MFDRPIGIAQLQGLPESIFGERIGGRDGESVREKRVSIFPVADLVKGNRSEYNNDHRRGRNEDFFRDSNCPNDCDEQSDVREIRVSIGNRLSADLHDSDDRYESADEPEPTGEKIWSGAAEQTCSR